jgi:hypothetical protein
VRVLHAFYEVSMLAQSLQWLPPDRGNARQLARAPSSISPNRSGRQSCLDALVHREDDDPLGERHAQLIHTLPEGETRRNG